MKILMFLIAFVNFLSVIEIVRNRKSSKHRWFADGGIVTLSIYVQLIVIFCLIGYML